MDNVTLLILAAALIGIFAWAVYYYEQTRSNSFLQIARRMGMAFREQSDEDIEGEYRNIHLFSQGHDKTVRNMIYGFRDGADVKIFEYHYITGDGRPLQNHAQTVLMFQSRNLELPEFYLCPRNMFYDFEASIGRREIHVDSHPIVSASYILRGCDEMRLRKIFNDEILYHLEGSTGICIEGGENRMLYYREGVQIRPEKISAFYQEGLTALRLFESSYRWK